MRISLEHGSGGALSRELTEQVIYPLFRSGRYSELNDATPFTPDNSLFLTTDTYVVDPIFFPGGNIGDLAINGTVNDLAMCGARPRYLSVGVILEEGFPMKDLRTIVASMGQAARKAGAPVLALNARAETIRQIARGGGIDRLDPQQRKQLPADVRTDDPRYEKLLNLYMNVHAAATPERLRPMVEAQIAAKSDCAAVSQISSVCRSSRGSPARPAEERQ